MDYHVLLKHMLSKTGAYEDYPFDFETQVIKVMGKMFALLRLESSPLEMNLKCDPEEALILRQIYDAVIPGYHMNKKHWNTIILDNTIPEEVIIQMVDRSYELVVKGLKKSDREKLERISNRSS